MILQKKIDKKVKFKILKNKYGLRISLTTAHGTWPPTSDKLDLVHRGFCGNEVHYMREWYLYIDNNKGNNYP